MEKGILTSNLESKLAEILDKAIKLNGVMETLDGPAFKLVITAVDNNLGIKIPEPYQTQIRDLLTDILEETDYAAAAIKASAFVDGLVDIPGLDDATEKFIFDGVFTAIAGLLVKPNTEKA